MLETHRHLLIANRAAIVEDLLVEDVLTYLRSKFIIDQDDSDLITGAQTSRRRAEKLLDILPDKGYQAFQYFYESLEEKYAHLAQLLAKGMSGNQLGSDINGGIPFENVNGQGKNLVTA